MHIFMTVLPFRVVKGRKAVAGDFVYSFNRITDLRTGSPGLWIFHDVERTGDRYAFDARNDSTLVIRLNKPFPPFIGLLTTMYGSVVPEEAVKYFGGDFRKNP